MQGQLTAIAGRDGPVHMKWEAFGEELTSLDALQNGWRMDARVEAVVQCSASAAAFALGRASKPWLGGHVYRRGAMKRVLTAATKENRREHAKPN